MEDNFTVGQTSNFLKQEHKMHNVGDKVFWLDNGVMQGRIAEVLQDGTVAISKQGEKGWTVAIDPKKGMYQSFEKACFAWKKITDKENKSRTPVKVSSSQ